MAIFHSAVSVVSRGKGQSAIAKAAYNAREKLRDERTGEWKDYSRAGEVQFSGIFAPKNAPEWTHDRTALWNAVERAEDGSTRPQQAQLARSMDLALPHELTDEQRRQLVTDFVREQFVRKGMIADVAIHRPGGEGDDRNHHAHILLTMREIGPDGFGPKVREWNNRGNVERWREAWEHTTNRYLERHGHEERIDRRTLEAQGIERDPTKHRGPHVDAMERKGLRTDRLHGQQSREEHRDLPGEVAGQTLSAADMKELQALRVDLRAVLQDIRHELATDTTLTREQKAELRQASSASWDDFRAVNHEITKRQLEERQTGEKPVKEIMADGARQVKSDVRAVEGAAARSVSAAKTVEKAGEKVAGKAIESVAEIAGKLIEGVAEFLSPTSWSQEQLETRAANQERQAEKSEFSARRYIEDREYRAEIDKHERERSEREAQEQAAERKREGRQR